MVSVDINHITNVRPRFGTMLAVFIVATALTVDPARGESSSAGIDGTVEVLTTRLSDSDRTVVSPCVVAPHADRHLLRNGMDVSLKPVLGWTLSAGCGSTLQTGQTTEPPNTPSLPFLPLTSFPPTLNLPSLSSL
jgi:hypothetical protein